MEKSVFEWGYLLIIVESVLFFCYCSMFMRRRWGNSLLFIPAMAMVFFIHWYMYCLDLDINYIFISMILDGVCMHIYFLSSFWRRMFHLALFYILYLTSQGVTILLFHLSVGYPMDDLFEQDTMAAATYMVSILVLHLLLVFCEKFRTEDRIYINKEYWFRLLFVPMVSIPVCLHICPFNRTPIDPLTSQILTIFLFFILLFNIFIYFYYRSITQAAVLAFRYESLQHFCQHQKTYWESIINEKRQQGDFIHDYIKHLHAVESLLTSRQMNNAIEYIQGLSGRISTTRAKRYTGNSVIDALLASQLTPLEDMGIHAAIEGDILPPDLPFDVVDLHLIIGNALANAGAACIRQELRGEAITILTTYRNRQLCFVFSNPADSNYNPTKTERRSGRGITIIEQVVEKYRGLLNIKIIDGVFKISILLNAPL